MTRWVTVLSVAALVGCNAGTIGNGQSGDTGPVSTCDGNPFTVEVDSVALAATTDGYDLDSHDTTSTSDPIGCGQVDAAGGIDNALANLAPTVSSFGFDINTMLGNAIQSGSVVIDITISGYDGGSDDSCVLVQATKNGSPLGDSVQGAIVSGDLQASLPTLELTGQVTAGGSPQNVDIHMRDVTLDFPISGEPDNPVVTNGLIGAGIPWDEGTSTDMRSLVLASLPSYVPPSVADGLISGKLDLQPNGQQSGSCDAMSAALVVGASAPAASTP